METAVKKLRVSLMQLNKLDKTVMQWHKEDPRNNKRTDFNHLDEKSIVFDLGGYLGDWTAEISARYSCTVHCFEPVKEYFDFAQKRFIKNPRIHVHQFGLGEKDLETYISVNEFSSRISTSNGSQKQLIKIFNFENFLREKQIEEIDLIKINIEGAEYDLLEHLISSDQIKNIASFLIQFHNFIPNHKERRDSIINKLNSSHQVTFSYPYVWECWQAQKNRY